LAMEIFVFARLHVRARKCSDVHQAMFEVGRRAPPQK
jgi:hypothetical protein